MADVTFSLAILAGLLSFLSPCVLPLVPPYLSYMAGATIDELTETGTARLRARAVLASLVFVAGFSTVFILLGASASILGQALRVWSGVLSTVAGVAIIAMGLHFLGVFRIGMLFREARFQARQPLGLGGAYVMGLAFAFGWTPCIGPVLGAILALAGSGDTLGRGAMLLGAYSLGLGVPFVLAALALGPFVALMRRLRSRMALVEKAMGVLLVLTGIGFLTGFMSTAAFWLLETFPALATLG